MNDASKKDALDMAYKSEISNVFTNLVSGLSTSSDNESIQSCIARATTGVALADKARNLMEDIFKK